MKKACLLIIFILITLSLFGCQTDKISDLIDLRASQYQSLAVNDKFVARGSKDQYIIDDFVPKMSRYTIKPFSGKLPDTSKYIVELISLNGNKIIIYDNYIVIDDKIYEIISGSIDFEKLYGVFMD